MSKKYIKFDNDNGAYYLEIAVKESIHGVSESGDAIVLHDIPMSIITELPFFKLVQSFNNEYIYSNGIVRIYINTFTNSCRIYKNISE